MKVKIIYLIIILQIIGFACTKSKTLQPHNNPLDPLSPGYAARVYYSAPVFVTSWAITNNVLSYGLAVNTSGNVYFADRNNNLLQKFDTSGHPLISWNSNLSYPYGIALNGSGNVYVCDNYHHRIMKFDSSGNYISQWGTLSTNTNLAIGFNYPEGSY